MKNKRTVILIVVLLIFSLACSLTNLINSAQEMGEQAQEVAQDVLDEEGEEENTELETSGEEETDVDETAGDIVDFDPEALNKLDSYRMTIEYRFENADGSVEEQTVEIAATRDPSAEQILMTGSVGDDVPGEIEMIRIGAQQWMRFGEEWIYNEDQDVEEDFLVDSASIDDINAEALAEAKDFGIETVNGIRCRHYELDEELAMFGDETMVGEVEEAQGDLWVAAEQDLPTFIVRYEVQVFGKATDTNPTEAFFLTMNVTEINSDIVIEAPEDLDDTSDGGSEDIPIMENAKNKTVMGGVIVYETESDFQEVLEFYAAEMEPAGWVKKSTVMSMENLLMETWAKEDRSLQLNITFDEETGVVLVTILVDVGG